MSATEYGLLTATIAIAILGGLIALSENKKAVAAANQAAIEEVR